MATCMDLASGLALLGAVLLLSEAVIAGKSPAQDVVFAIFGFLAYLASSYRTMFCRLPAYVVMMFLAMVSVATGWEVRPFVLNVIWALFIVLTPISVLFSTILGCCGGELDESDESGAQQADKEHSVPNGQQADSAPQEPKKKKKKKRINKKRAVLSAILIVAAAISAFMLTIGPKYIHMVRVRMATPGPVASSWRGSFQPLPWLDAEKKADQVLGQLTPDEKYSLLHGYGWPGGVIAGMEPNYGMYTGNTPAFPRLGVPSLNMADAANGFRPMHDVPIGTVTSWPCLLALGATWDPILVEDVASAIAVEFRGKGSNVLLGPSIQVHRTAWGGRNFEYMSGEDPYLGAVLARAYVLGVQGEGVMAVAKHWAFNEQETNRFEYNANIDERTAWELYYPPFEAAVEAGVCAFMCAYNRVNGSHSCNSRDILKRDLKGKLGFRGFVQSDWGATYRYSRSIENGLDQDMPGDDGLFTNEVLGSLNPSAVNEAARRILAALYRMRIDEYAWCTPPKCIEARLSDQHTAAHRILAAEAATRSVVLLKNENNILPFSRQGDIKKIAVVGPAADARCSLQEFDMGRCMAYYGGGSGSVVPGWAVTPLQGITARAQREGIWIVPVQDPTNLGTVISAVSQADAIIVVGHVSATEMFDRDIMHPELMMANEVDNMIFALATTAKNTPMVVLMQTPGSVVMPWLSKVNAVANLFLGGEETGTAWASILFGDVSPEGKLPVQFPKTVKDTIRHSQSKHFEYEERLFTSYRDPKTEYAYPFGHGLSYTTFEFGAPRLTKEGCPARICVGMAVSNTGSRPGREVAQAYLEFEGAAETPSKILRGFYKTRLLQPGESEEVVFNFTARDLSIYSVVTAGWDVQELVKVHIGASSADIRHVLPLYEVAQPEAPAPTPLQTKEPPVPATEPVGTAVAKEPVEAVQDTEEQPAEALATKEPRATAPATLEPAAAVRATEEPAVAAPAAEEPTAAVPAAEEPAAPASTAEEPAAAAPAAEEPAAAAPATKSKKKSKKPTEL